MDINQQVRIELDDDVWSYIIQYLSMQYLVTLKVSSKSIRKLVEQEQIKRCKFLEINSLNYLEFLLYFLYNGFYHTFTKNPWNPPKPEFFNPRVWSQDSYSQHFNSKLSNIESKYSNLMIHDNINFYLQCSINIIRGKCSLLDWDSILFPFGYKDFTTIISNSNCRWGKSEENICECTERNAKNLQLIDYIRAFYLAKRSDRKSNTYNECVENLTIEFNHNIKSVLLKLEFSWNRDS